jgi:hypothetical protein
VRVRCIACDVAGKFGHPRLQDGRVLFQGHARLNGEEAVGPPSGEGK